MKLLLRITIFVLSFITISANAEVDKIPIWDNPGSAPFTGTNEEGCQYVNKASGFDYATCLNATDKLDELRSGKTVSDDNFRIYHIQDGDVVFTTQTNLKTGKSSAVKRVTDMNYQSGPLKGQALPPNHPLRRSMVYLTGVDGAAIASPDACANNPTLLWPKNLEPVVTKEVIVTVVETVKEEKAKQKCELVKTSSQIVSNGFVSVMPMWACGHLLGGFTSGIPAGSQTTSEYVCNEGE